MGASLEPFPFGHLLRQVGMHDLYRVKPWAVILGIDAIDLTQQDHESIRPHGHTFALRYLEAASVHSRHRQPQAE